jgi:hypothetical protein
VIADELPLAAIISIAIILIVFLALFGWLLWLAAHAPEGRRDGGGYHGRPR